MDNPRQLAKMEDGCDGQVTPRLCVLTQSSSNSMHTHCLFVVTNSVLNPLCTCSPGLSGCSMCISSFFSWHALSVVHLDYPGELHICLTEAGCFVFACEDSPAGQGPSTGLSGEALVPLKAWLIGHRDGEMLLWRQRLQPRNTIWG